MKKILIFLLAIICLVSFFTSCKPVESYDKLDSTKFDTTINNKTVKLYDLKNNNGMLVQITNYGGRIASVWVPDSSGNFADVVTGYDSIEGFLKDSKFFGALIGRYGNRIAKGKFTLNGKEYTLALNNFPNSLHGGRIGYDHVVWDVEKNSEDTLVLTYFSPAGEENYPGNLSVKVTYSLNDSNDLRIDYHAVTDSATVINLTNHVYFNLAGHNSGDILNHILMINADGFTPVDSTLIPTGEIRNVAGTPFDFNTPTAIGARINADDQQIKFGMGYDHNWVLNKDSNEMSLAARVEEPVSGRILEVYTTEPGMQVYTGNFMDGSMGKKEASYKFRNAFCLETQHFPDSPNQVNFPSTVLNPGEEYTSSTIYRFSVK